MGRRGLGHCARDDVARALRRGQRPDGSVLSTPMPIFRALDDVDVSALYTYLRSLPPRRKARDKSADELARWIRDPERFVPGTQVPT